LVRELGWFQKKSGISVEEKKISYISTHKLGTKWS